MTRYAFDNASEQAGAHHDALSQLLDGQTRAYIGELVELPGKSCLEVGAGGGGMAAWLADRGAEVTATDIAPQRIPARPGLTVRRHDVVTDDPPGRFDLVHARLVLGHLPQRMRALHHMVEALAPQGVLVTGDFLLAPGPFVAYAPDEQTTEVLSRYIKAHLRTLEAHGNDDPEWPHRTPAAFAAAGLTDVSFRLHGGSWHGGGPGCRLLLATIPQMRGTLLEHGLTDDDLTATTTALADPRLVLNGFIFFQTSGRLDN
jgi:SAM-dependent methyltransferase